MSSSIGQSAGSVYIEIFGDNKRLANDLKHTESMLRKHAAAMSGLQVFKPTLFTSQLAGIAAMARGSGVLHSQLNAMTTLAPKLGALVSPFQAMRTAMTGMQHVFHPGIVVKNAQSAVTAAQAEYDKMQKSLVAKTGYTPTAAKNALRPYLDELKRVQAQVASPSKLLSSLEYQQTVKSRPAAIQSAIQNRGRLDALHVERVKVLAKSKGDQAAIEKAEKDLAVLRIAHERSRGKDPQLWQRSLTIGENSVTAAKAAATANVESIKAIEQEIKKLGDVPGVKALEKELKTAKAEADKMAGALAKVEEAEEKLEKVRAGIRGKLGRDKISPQAAAAQLVAPMAEVEKAKKALQAAQGTSKLDIMGGGAVSAITNVIIGVMSVGKIVWGVASSIFSVFKGIFNALASVAHAIINVLGEAFTFLKNLAVHTFQIVSVAALAVGTAMVAGLRSVFEKGKDLLNAYAQTGIRVKQALIIETAASMTGVDKENISTLVNRMQRAISGVDKEGPKIKDALRGLGLELGKLQGMSPVEQLTAISEGLGKISDPATRAGVATDIFSVRGAQMIAMLLQMTEGVRLARLQWGQAGDAFDKNKDKFAYIARSIEGITQVKIPSFFAGIATPLVNTLSWLSDKLNAFDPFKSGFKIGTKIDEYLRLIIGAFQKGQLMEWLGLELKVAFLEAVNYLIAGLMVAGDVIAGAFQIDGFFPAITKGLSGAFKIAVGVFLEAFQGILPTMGAGIGWLVDKLIQGIKYAKNIFLGGGIGSVAGGGVGATLAVATGNPELAPLAWKAGALAGGAIGTGVAGYFGIPESNTHFQDEFRKEAIDVNTPARASGGPVTGGKPVLVGEKGPEIFVPHDSGEVISNNDLRHLADGTPGASEYSKHDWLAEAAARTAAAKKSAPTGGGQPHLGGVERGPAFPNVTISKLGIGAGVMTPTQDVPLVFASPQFEQAFHKMHADEKLSYAQRLQKEGIADFGTSAELFSKSVPQISAILAKSVADNFHPNKAAEAKKDALVKKRDALVAEQKALTEQIENPPTRDNANAMLASVKKQIASKQAQIDSGDLSPRAEEQAKYDLAKLQKQAAYNQAKINEQKAYNQSTGADDAKRRAIKSLQRKIDAKEKEIDEVQGLGPRDVMVVGADKTRLAALNKKLMAQGLVSSNGKSFDVSDQPPANNAGVASGFGTMSGWSAGRLGSFATGGTSKMEKHLENIDHNTRGLTTGYGP